MTTKFIVNCAAALVLTATGGLWAYSSAPQAQTVAATASDCCGCDCCATGDCFPGCCPCDCFAEGCCEKGLACCEVGAACCSEATSLAGKACTAEDACKATAVSADKGAKPCCKVGSQPRAE